MFTKENVISQFKAGCSFLKKSENSLVRTMKIPWHSPQKTKFQLAPAGIYLFAMGLAKKVLLADIFGDVVTYGFTTLEQLKP